MRTFGDQIKPSTLSPASLDPLKSRLLSSLSTPLIKISSSLKQSAQPRRARATLATQHSADPGDTLKNARKIGVLKSDLFAANPFRRFRNSIGGSKNRKDKNDYYRFTLKNPSNFKLQLNGLSVNADVQIIRLDRKGNATRNPTPSQDPIQQAISDLTISPQGGIRTSKSGFDSEEIDLFRLPKGDYAVRVYTRSKQKTKYNLDLFATPSANGNFNIEFDYRFDTNGFFSDPARRATLEAAAFVWESWINDDLDDVPAGISYTILNPQAGSETPRITLTSPTDDLLIFVGAQSPPFGITGAAAAAGPNGYDAGGSIFSNRLDSDFEPWAGNISFEPSLSWFSDLTPSVSWDDLSGVDLLSVSLHEMGHVLGMGPSGIFGQIGTNGFDGVNALKVNQNYPISLEPDLAHVKSGQMSIMTGPPSSRLPTLIDLAILADIGYEIPGFTAQGSVRPIATQENETIFGTTLDDTIDGLGGNDTLLGQEGNDALSGGEGDDFLDGGDGNDVLDGLGGNDTLQGQGGNDALSGGEGNDTLFGQEGNDALFGGEGDDFLGGGDGNDVLDGGAGNDLFNGDAGRDIFIFGAGSGQDNINGFVVSEDTIQLSAVAGYQIIQSGGTTGGGLFTRLAIGSNGDQVTVFHDLPLTTVNFSLV